MTFFLQQHLWARLVGLLMCILLFVSCSKNQTVMIIGQFPKEVEAYAKLTVEKNGEKWQHSSPIREGQYEFELDSLETGIYDLKIEWSVPFEKRYRTKRNKKGEIIKEYNPKGYWTHRLFKRIYINPDQSLKYHIGFERDVSEEMIYELTEDTTNRADLYRLKVVTESEDALLFDRLDSIEASYGGYAYSVILDSLFEASDNPNKLYRDFSSLARKLNLNRNYVDYANKKMLLVAEHLDNPVAVLELLNVDRRLLMANLDKYKEVVAELKGRAQQSAYYDSLVTKMAGLPSQLKIGEEVPAPTGHAPDYGPVTFDLASHRYSLIVFWASWDEVSRKQNEVWDTLLDRYGNKGFQVLGLSVDENIGDWRSGIEKGHLQRWFHLSDVGQGFAGNNVLRYGVKSVPYAVLIDQQGRMVAEDMDPLAVANFLEEGL